MFKRIEKWLCKKQRVQRVSGLSKGLEVVDNLMVPGLCIKALDQNYGRAEITLKLMHQNNELTANELGAALITLNNQYDKLRKKAWYAQLYT